MESNFLLTQKSTGIGMHTKERKAKTVHAQESPRPANIAGLKSGNAAANADRSTTVAAIALAA